MIDAPHEPTPRTPRLEVRVVHGSLEHAEHPVAVGHYQGMPLDGAEKALDGCLDGLLTERLRLGTYAEQEGTAVLVTGAPDCSPSGALVLGLGPAGDVTAEKVTRAMTQAALLRALSAAERNTDGDVERIGVSTVLVGANPLDGIPIARSLAALVEGVAVASQLIAESARLRKRVRLAAVEVVELYETRAEVANAALGSLGTMLQAAGPDIEVRAIKKLTKRAGARSGGLPPDYNEGSWLRLDIRGATDGAAEPDGYRRLELTSAARRARADRLEQTLEIAAVDGLIDEAVNRAHPDEQIANTLYELLLPNELKADLQAADNLSLVVDAETAHYPWEALAPRGDDGELRPLALGAGMLRQFADSDTRNARFAVRHAAGRHALVVGNPPAGPAQDLPGAAEEAASVAGLLSASTNGGEPLFEVAALTWKDGELDSSGLPADTQDDSWTEIVNALYRFQYRVVHIAAHGAFNQDKPAESGILIGPGRFLTAQTMKQLATVPELVFLNCCYSGQIEDVETGPLEGNTGVHVFASSVAQALMSIGVRAVVAAGWSVDDSAALAFATTFYEQMLGDADLGDAVRAARRKASETGSSMTWAAYQCYGDPAYRLAPQLT